jgi:hypothetical protein
MSKRRRICAKPTGASFATPSVPRKSRSPSADTVPDFSGISMAVATAFSVTPAQATSASSSMSPPPASPHYLAAFEAEALVLSFNPGSSTGNLE